MVIFCWLSVDAPAGLVVWAFSYGFSSGALIGVNVFSSILPQDTHILCLIMQLMPACIGKFTPDTTKYGGRAGLLFGFVSFAALTGPPIAGGKCFAFTHV